MNKKGKIKDSTVTRGHRPISLSAVNRTLPGVLEESLGENSCFVFFILKKKGKRGQVGDESKELRKNVKRDRSPILQGCPSNDGRFFQVLPLPKCQFTSQMKGDCRDWPRDAGHPKQLRVA